GERPELDRAVREGVEHSVANWVSRQYARMDEAEIVDRDLIAFSAARRLQDHAHVLVSSDARVRVLKTLMARIASLGPGGRSYSLYALLLMARSGILEIPLGDEEQFIGTLLAVPYS